ncbi:MAG: ribosomal protein L11 methyltransferase [Bacteroidetes bacterium]|nr:ribosomal protein L11 methyltransferase [Bacteroidota bacterium]
MNRRNWIRVELSLSPEEQDLLIGRLGLVGFEGFQQEGRTLLCFTNQRRWKKFAQKELVALLSQFRLECAGPDIGFNVNVVREENWNKKWEASIGIVEATKRIIIKPSWKKLRSRDKGKLVILIDPKMSFGTGHHESTRLSLVLLERHVKPGSTVLDFGCGSGILAIAAAKLGAKTVLALDNDDWAVSNARENVRKNRVENKVRVLLGDLTELTSKQFDVIVANIDFPTIIQSLPDLSHRLKEKGIIIFSGLLSSDQSRLVVELDRHNLTPLDISSENEWLALSVGRAG